MKKVAITLVVLATIGAFLPDAETKTETVAVAQPTVEKVVAPKPKKLSWNEAYALLTTDKERAAKVLKEAQFYAGGMCKELGKKAAKNRRTVKYDWGNDGVKKFYNSDDNIASLEIYIGGQAQNGFGAMVDYSPVCMFVIDMNTFNGEFKNIDNVMKVDYVYVNGKKVYKS